MQTAGSVDEDQAAGLEDEGNEEECSSSEDEDISQRRKRKGKKLKGQHKIDNKRQAQSSSKAFFKDLL